ncbi:MAG: phosphotransferase family protein [Phycisphaerae bacterium]|nr:phosphotransferase [Tepidisphaeraceae bacterium]
MLDIESHPALLAYLRTTARIAPAESPALTTLAGGVSNKTVLVERPTGDSWVLKQALPQLRVAVEWHADPRRIEREALGIRHLADICPPGSITPLIFEDPDRYLLAMQAVPKPHDNFKSVLLAGHVDPDHIAQFARLLATIHRAGHDRRDELSRVFADRSFFESLRLEPYYLYAAASVPEAADFLHALVADTRARQLSLVHGDYSPKNVLISAGQLILLDHEVIHFGDPAFDLGFSLTHLLSKAHHLRPHRAAFRTAAHRYWSAYTAALGPSPFRALEPFAVRHTLACLLARVAGRSPLEYLTADERARQRHAVVQLMAAPPTAVPALVDAFLSLI